MKTELNHSFEYKNDPQTTKFHRRAILITCLLAYGIACSMAIGIVKMANFLAQKDWFDKIDNFLK